MRATTNKSTEVDYYEQIHFSGNGIRLLELKREVIERKKLSGLEFDLKVVDDNGKGLK